MLIIRLRDKHFITFLYLQASYTDATLAVDGKFYPVHKLVLSTCSEYFSDIFERTPCKSPVVVLKDVRSQDLEALLDYMYLGEVNVNQNDLSLLLRTAECLRIKGLAVPDDEPTKHSNLNSKFEFDSLPPAKRKREDPSTSSSIHVSTSTSVSSPTLSSQNDLLDPKSPSGIEDVPVKLEKDGSEEACPSDSNVDDAVDCEKSESNTTKIPSLSNNQSQQVSKNQENKTRAKQFLDVYLGTGTN